MGDHASRMANEKLLYHFLVLCHVSPPPLANAESASRTVPELLDEGLQVFTTAAIVPLYGGRKGVKRYPGGTSMCRRVGGTPVHGRTGADSCAGP